MRDIQYQAEKEARVKTDSKSIISQKYHNYLNVFSKKDLDIFSLYQKYYHKIHLEKKKKLGHALLYKISSKNVDTIK